MIPEHILIDGINEAIRSASIEAYELEKNKHLWPQFVQEKSHQQATSHVTTKRLVYVA